MAAKQPVKPTSAPQGVITSAPKVSAATQQIYNVYAQAEKSGSPQAAAAIILQNVKLAKTSSGAQSMIDLANKYLSQATISSGGGNTSGGNGGGGGGGEISYSPAYIQATPIQPPPPPPPPSPPAMITTAVKQADPSIILYNEQDTPQELLTYLLYEDVSGTELINISRHDTINGQQVGYSLIKNLSVLNKAFNPNNILAGQTTYAAYLNQYAIDLPNKLSSYRDTYIDENGNQISDDINIVYLDNGDLVIEFTNLNDDEYAEVQISTNGTIYSIGA